MTARIHFLLDPAEIAAAQRRLEQLIRSRATWSDKRTLGFKGGNFATDVSWLDDVQLWYTAPDQKEKIWHNGFGTQDPRDRQMLSITLWLNPQKSGVDRHANAAFVRDDNGHLLLVHSGRLGGGKKGVGKRAFLQNYAGPTISVDGQTFVLVADLDGETAVDDIAVYVRHVAAFKEGVDPDTGEYSDAPDETYPDDGHDYWIFQANPAKFDLVRHLANKRPGDLDHWIVTRYDDEMHADDGVFLWLSGPHAGIYAEGTLTGSPTPTSGPNEFTGGDKPTHRVEFRYERIFTEPLLRPVIIADPLLAKLQVVRQPQGTNFRVDLEQWDRLHGLLAGDVVGGDDETREPEEGDRGLDFAPWFRDVILSTYADDATRRVILDTLADIIRHADRQSAACWAITRQQGRARVLVGETVAFDLRRGRVRIGLHLGSIPEVEQARTLGDTDESDVQRERIEQSVVRQFSPLRFATVADVLQPAWRRFVELAAAQFPNSPFARHHRPETIAEIERLVGAPLPRPTHKPDAATTFWKIAPGERGRFWPKCRDGSYIAIGWDELGDLSGLDRAGFDARVDHTLKQHPHWKRAGLEQVWRFINIPVGARIVANEGTKRVVGIGTVIGPYHYVDDGTEFFHRLPVRWDDIRERVVHQPSWLQTLRQLSESVFADIVGAPSPGDARPQPSDNEAEPVEKLDFDGLMDRLGDAGLRFPVELAASYLLGLQAKRFVILSGISGTGKTQLAVEVARAFQPASALVEPLPAAAPATFQRIRVQPYMLKFRRLVVPAALVDAFELDDQAGRMTVHFGDGASESLRWSPAGTATQLLFKGAFRQWFAQTFTVGDELDIAIEREDPPELRVTRVTPAVAPIVAQPAAPTYRIVAVRPDWTDNRGLLGYYNPITREYHVTPFLQLLLDAADEDERATRDGRPRLPYFVVLDEMNLARVEHYFSDFLSCLESGDKLHLHDDPRVEMGESGHPVPRQLAIPRNLFFTGTVNVDETTYMFSPKVLDRAFVLEFNDVYLEHFGSAEDDDDDDSPLRLKAFKGALDIRERPAVADYQELRGLLAGALHAALVSLNARLQPDNRHFGYRVANEIARFVRLAAEQAGTDPTILWEALDVAVLAKVLPKMHGTQQEVEHALARMLAFAVDPSSSPSELGRCEDWSYERGRLVARADGARAPRLARCAAKLWRMLRRVRQQGHVSFIE
jgi:5-methylcytosine-specific restriction protein B